MLFAVAYYTLIGSINSSVVKKFAKTNPDVGQNVFMALTISIVIFIALQYPLGALSDKIGRKPMMLIFTVFYAVAMVPLSSLIKPDLLSLTILYVLGMSAFAFASCILPAIMAELFPTEVRSTGIGAWYNITVAIFGGGAPYLITWLNQNQMGDRFFWVVSAVAAVATLIILTMPETRGKKLD